MIKIIDSTRAQEIFLEPASKKNKGRFFIFETKHSKAVAIDNTTADAFTEEFDTWTQAIKWLSQEMKEEE